MSEARNQRFEIDIDEIERQLRRSVEQPAEPRPDPLAELARIVGQNDPFQGILTGAPARGRVEPANANVQAPPVQPEHHAAPSVTHLAQPGYDPAHEQDFSQQHAYDPVADAYGSSDAALTEEDFKPLRRRPSRGKLVAVMAALLVTVSAVAAALTWRKSGGFASGTPPTIVADKSPLKVAPENPGGVEVPNQDRQIYARAPQDGQSRVVDGREQPVDVRAATPAAPPRPVAADRGPSVSDALGEPRRVRTVAVNPDGSAYTPGASTPVARSAQNVIPSGDLPPPVPVQTVAVPARTAAPTPAAAAPAPVAAAPQPSEPASTHQAVNVLPPVRPNLGDRPAPSADAPTRTASLPAPAAAKPAPKPAAEAAKPARPAVAARTETPAAAEKPAAEKPAAGAKTFTVQIAVRPSEQEARQAWDQAQSQFGASLDNKPARLTSAKVAGKTVHRVRLGPMTKPEADAMCGRLKSKGGNCFVAQN